MAIPVTIGDHCRLILKGRFDGAVETNNVFYMKVTESADVTVPPPTLADMALGFWEGIKTDLLNLTSHVQVYNEIVAELLDADANLVNGESMFIDPADGVGGQAGESLPSFANYTLKIVRPSSAKRHGFKRFAGVPENQQHNGIAEASTITALNTLGDDLMADFHFHRVIATVLTDIQGTFNLELVQRVLNGDLVSPAVFYFPTTVVFDKIGHQNTRDRGRGV